MNRFILGALLLILTASTTLAQRAEGWTTNELAQVCLKGGWRRCTSLFPSGDTWFPYNGSQDSGMWYHDGLETPVKRENLPVAGTTFEWMIISDQLFIKPLGWAYQPEWPIVVDLHQFVEFDYNVLALKVLMPDAFISVGHYEFPGNVWVEDLRADAVDEVILMRDPQNYEGRRGRMFLGQNTLGRSGIQFAPSVLDTRGWNAFWAN